MSKLDLSPEEAGELYVFLASLAGGKEAGPLPPGAVAGVSLNMPGPNRARWICSPIRWPCNPDTDPRHRVIDICTRCEERVWKNDEALEDAEVVCWNCAIEEMLDLLGLEYSGVIDGGSLQIS